MISQSELITLSGKSHADINLLCCGKKWENVYIWLCAMKKSLGEYSKHNKYDNVQLCILGHIAWIEKYLWNAYYTFELPRFLRVNPSFALKDKQYAKRELVKNFTTLMKRGYH